jgi:hypothetical protein
MKAAFAAGDRAAALVEAKAFVSVQAGNTSNRAYPLVKRLLTELEHADTEIKELTECLPKH